jgi:hypothetical protein
MHEIDIFIWNIQNYSYLCRRKKIKMKTMLHHVHHHYHHHCNSGEMML